jgi:hypothetical protein
MKIEVLFFDGCPSFGVLLPRLRNLISEIRPDTSIELRRIETPVAAEAERFLGSPTVRVDGADVEPGAEARLDFGLKCRLFRTEEGSSPTPPDEWLRAALEQGGAG